MERCTAVGGPSGFIMMFIILPSLAFIALIVWAIREGENDTRWRTTNLMLTDLLRLDSSSRGEAILHECLKLCTDKREIRTERPGGITKDDFEVVKALAQRQVVLDYYLQTRWEAFYKWNLSCSRPYIQGEHNTRKKGSLKAKCTYLPSLISWHYWKTNPSKRFPLLVTLVINHCFPFH